MYYSKEVRKYGDYCYTDTGKAKVMPYFIRDIAIMKPDYIRETKNRIYVFFNGKYSVFYTLPISYKILVYSATWDIKKEGIF